MTDTNKEQVGAISALMQDMVQLKDELALQAHLMTMELNDEWETLQKRATELELKLKHSLETFTEEVAKAEENFFVGDENELNRLVDEFRDLKDKHHNNNNGKQ